MGSTSHHRRRHGRRCHRPRPSTSPAPATASRIARWQSASRAPASWSIASPTTIGRCREYVRSLPAGLSDDWQADKAPPPDITGDDAERRKKLALKNGRHCIQPALVHACGALPARIPRSQTRPTASPPVICFHAGLRYEAGKYLPAMVCLLRDINSNEPCGIHRTFIHRHTGKKIDRKMLGIAKGAAIKLDAVPLDAHDWRRGRDGAGGARCWLHPAWALRSSVPSLLSGAAASARADHPAREPSDQPPYVNTCSRHYLASAASCKH